MLKILTHEKITYACNSNAAVCNCSCNVAEPSQQGKKAVSKEISGITGNDSGSETAKAGEEPACACDDAVFIIDLGKYKLDYRETSISLKDDGSILLRDRIGGKYYIVRNGATEGPWVRMMKESKDSLVQAAETQEIITATTGQIVTLHTSHAREISTLYVSAGKATGHTL